MRPQLRRRQWLAASLLSMLLRPAAAQDKAAGAAVLSVGGPGLAGPRPGHRAEFEAAQLERLPQRTIRTSTPWYPGPRDFTGPLLRDVLAAAGLPARAEGTARCTALNDYRVDVPLDDARRFDVIVARLLDGKPMSVREKGPLFIMYPFDERPELRTSVYFSRCIWQLKAIEVV